MSWYEIDDEVGDDNPFQFVIVFTKYMHRHKYNWKKITRQIMLQCPKTSIQFGDRHVNNDKELTCLH